MKNQKKFEPTPHENLIALYRELLCTVDIKDVVFPDTYTGDEKRDFYKFAHETFNNPFFKKIIKEFVFAQCLLQAEKGVTSEDYYMGKMTINGIKILEEYFGKYARQYEIEFLSEQQKFDPHRSFEPVKKQDI